MTAGPSGRAQSTAMSESKIDAWACSTYPQFG